VVERTYISVELAARLVGRTPRLLQQKIADGTMEAQEVASIGGNGGTAYRVPLDTLPTEAQILYYSAIGGQSNDGNADLVSYKARYGDEGLKELLKARKTVLASDGLRKQCAGRNLQTELAKLAADGGITLRTLYRWENAYKHNGLPGLMRKGRNDAGASRTMCNEARQQVLNEYLAPERRAQDAILDHVRERAKLLGAKACEQCLYRRGSDQRDAMIGTGELRFYPECDRAGSGIVVPENRSAINRVIATLTEEEKTYMRVGRQKWRSDHMLKAKREKPGTINDVWFGDHGQFDVFVIDHDGRCVRPWLTGWFDGGSGCLVGWTVSTNPNSRTITHAFTRAAAAKQKSPIRGVPNSVYVDNGKDYRCEALEGGTIRLKELGKLDHDMGSSPLYEALGVSVQHAASYSGWVKPIERFWRTTWERFCRELPGYCGGATDKRPENFERSLQKLFLSGSLLTIDELADRFLNDYLPAYHSTPNAGYGNQKPIDLYNTLPRARDYVPGWSLLALAMEEIAERKVSPQGIRFEGRLYWNIGIMHMAGERVVIRYDRDNLSSITVCTLKGQYICMAEPKDTMKMVGEDPAKVAIHVAMQRQQERELRDGLRAKGVKLPGKRASGHVYYEDVDEEYQGNGNIVSVAAQKAAQGRKELAKSKSRDNKEASGGGEDRTAAMFRRMYEQMKEAK